MKRKPPEPTEDGCALWVVTFGDAMSLLVTFFVMLVSFASFEESALLELVGSMKGGLRGTPVPLATSIAAPVPANQLEAAEDIASVPLASEEDAVIDGNSMKDAVSRMYPPDTSDYFLQMLDNGVSLVVRSGAVFESGTARIRRPDSDVWRIAGGLMSMVGSEIRIVAKLPKNTVVRMASCSTAWGLGVEQALEIQRFLTGRFGVNPRQVSVAMQVVESMPPGEASEGSIEIRYIGMNLLHFRDIPKYILQNKWRDLPSNGEDL